MAKKWYGILILVGSIISPWAFSEKAFVLVFLEDAPLRFIKVAVDGKIVGVTNAKGLVEADLETGPHKLYLISDDNAVPVRFNLPENGQIEISVFLPACLPACPSVLPSASFCFLLPSSLVR